MYFAGVSHPERSRTTAVSPHEAAATWEAAPAHCPSRMAPVEFFAARAFYGDALRGRQVRRPGHLDMPERLWFLIAGALVEVRPELRSETTPLTLNVADPWELAERCWDAGFVLEVDTAVTGEPVVSVIGPFGRRIRLAPRVAATRPRGEM